MLHYTLTYQAFLLLLLLASLAGCSEHKENAFKISQKGYEFVDIEFKNLKHRQTVYVPVYSDIYHMSGDERFSLTITASVRNTSMIDTMYVNKVAYYNSKGELLRKYLDKSIILPPLASAAFVVDYLENQGGAGASFIIDYGSNNSSIKPIIQGIMIGTLSQQGISFITEGVVIENGS